MFTDKKVKGI